jgi:hypothetical protein
MANAQPPLAQGFSSPIYMVDAQPPLAQGFSSLVYG